MESDRTDDSTHLDDCGDLKAQILTLMQERDELKQRNAQLEEQSSELEKELLFFRTNFGGNFHQDENNDIFFDSAPFSTPDFPPLIAPNESNTTPTDETICELVGDQSSMEITSFIEYVSRFIGTHTNNLIDIEDQELYRSRTYSVNKVAKNLVEQITQFKIEEALVKEQLERIEVEKKRIDFLEIVFSNSLPLLDPKTSTKLGSILSKQPLLLIELLESVLLDSKSGKWFEYLFRLFEAKINIKMHGMSLLNTACGSLSDPLSVMKFLIEEKGILMDFKSKDNCINLEYIFAQNSKKFEKNLFLSPNFEKNQILDLVKFIFNHCKDDTIVNEKGGRLYTILHLACIHVNTTPVDVFEYLIGEKGADVNLQDGLFNNTPLHLIFQHFSQFDQQNKNDQNGRIKNGIAVIKYFLSQPSININLKNSKSRTILHSACEKMDIIPNDIYVDLIEVKKAGINDQDFDYYGNTPLHFAMSTTKTSNGRQNILYLLDRPGISVLRQNKYGKNVLHFAAENINFLNFDIFDKIIEKNGNVVTVLDKQYETPLHNCFRNLTTPQTNIEIIKLLLNQPNVNVNEKNKNGKSLTHFFCEKINNIPFFLGQFFLHKKYADLTIQDENGDSPLHLAISRFDENNGGDVDLLELLLSQQNINFGQKNKQGRNLMHYLCKNINNIPFKIFYFSLQKNNNADLLGIYDADNHTPLHFAFQHFKDTSDVDIIGYLLSKCGGINGQQNDNNSRSNTNIIKQIDFYGKTCLDLAFSRTKSIGQQLSTPPSIKLIKYIIQNDILAHLIEPTQHLFWVTKVNYLSLEIIQLFFGKEDNHIDINYFDHFGNNVLHNIVSNMACNILDDELCVIVELMIQNGADLHKRNRQGQLPGEIITEKTFPKTFQILNCKNE
jgi:ankyrin repeat protein